MIPFYNFKEIHRPKVEQELIESAMDVIVSGNYVFGTHKFEEDFADYVGSKYCVAVSSGTSALHLGLKSLGIGPGDEVITVSHTFKATIAAIKYLGATPVYVDINPHTFCMDATKIQKAITPNTKCILPVHLYGNMANMEGICAIAEAHNIPIIEDCSQAHGSTFKEKHAGTFGKLGTFSFYPGKGLGALGDAGCIVTDDPDIYEYACEARSWHETEVGFNYRMSNIQAEFLRVKLKHFDEVLESKREIASFYNKFFNDVYTKNVQHSYHIYPVLSNDRDSLIAKCKGKVELKMHYPKPVHKTPGHIAPYHLPVTEMISSSQVSLPIYPGVEWQEVINTVMEHNT
jgi:dTDP-4-amino-4,6-dideoxygalactose transaminase